MRTYKKITVLTIVIVSAFFCLAQFSPRKAATNCNTYQQQASTVAINAEDFSLINLLTLKFM